MMLVHKLFQRPQRGTIRIHYSTSTLIMPTDQSRSPSVPLREWAQSRLTSLYEIPTSSGESNTDATTHFSLESVFSSNAQIFANHEPVTLDEFKKEIAQTFGSVKSSVEWKEFMDIPTSDANQQTGIVAGFLVVTRTLKFRIRAAPAQNHTYITLSAKIEQDPEAADGESGDTRKIVHLFHTSQSKAAPVHFAGSPVE